MAGITAAPTVTCITRSPAAAEVVVAAVSGRATDAASTTSAMVVHSCRARGVRRSIRVSSSQPSSEAATAVPTTWPIVIVWMGRAEAEAQVDAQQGDFRDPGEGGGECAARSAQRPGAALLDGRNGGDGGGEHVGTPSGGSRRPVAPLLTRFSRAEVIGHRPAGVRWATAPAAAGSPSAVPRRPAQRR